MPYTQVNLGLSPQVKAALLAGHSIKVPHNELVGNDPIFLTASQIKRIQAAVALKKGLTLKLSNRQIGLNTVIEDVLPEPVMKPKAGATAPSNMFAMQNHSAQDPGAQTGAGQTGGWSPLGQVGYLVGVPDVGGSVKPKKTKKGGFIGSLLGFGAKQAVQQPVQQGNGIFDRVKTVVGRAKDFASNPTKAVLTQSLPVGDFAAKVPYGENIMDLAIEQGSKRLVPGSGLYMGKGVTTKKRGRKPKVLEQGSGIYM